MGRKKRVSRVISLEDNAIILKLRKHGENSAVIQMLTQNHGVYHGVVRSATSKNNRGIYQPGNLIHGVWSARIAEHIGSIKGELMRPYAAHIMQSPLALSVLSSMCALLVAALPERHTYPKLYEATLTLLESLQAGNEADFLHEYVEFELTLLAETGFGLDLSRCAATGQITDLLYVSPKSGRAVSREAGEPYKGKLLPYPKPGNIPQALTLTGYFLEHWLLESHHKKMPQARERLIKTLYNLG